MGKPAPTSTPLYTRRDCYRLSRLDLGLLNQTLQRISLRLDQLDAIGQNPDVRGRRIVNLALAINSADAARYSQIAGVSGDFQASRLVGTDAAGALVSVADLTAYVKGGNDILATDNGDGTVTIDLDLAEGLYVGDPNVDGTWYLAQEGTDFVVKRREAGVWNEKARFMA